MRINPFVVLEDCNKTSFDPKVYHKSKLIERKRLIYLIDDDSLPTNLQTIFNNRQLFYIILINYAKTKTSENSIVYTKSHYIFNAYCTKDALLKGFLDLNVNLQHIFVTGYEKYDYHSYIDMGSGMADDFFSYSGPRSINFNDLYSDSVDMHSKDLDILDPRYYNRKHFEIESGNNYDSVFFLDKYIYDGKELFDDETVLYKVSTKVDIENEIEIYKTKKEYNLPVLVKDTDALFCTWEQRALINNFPLELFQLNHESMFSSYIAIYNSKDGIKLNNIYYPKEFVIKERLCDYITYIEREIVRQAKKIESVCGNITLYYYFSNIKETLTVLFDDNEYKKITSHFKPKEMIGRADACNFYYKYEDEVISYLKGLSYYDNPNYS